MRDREYSEDSNSSTPIIARVFEVEAQWEPTTEDYGVTSGMRADETDPVPFSSGQGATVQPCNVGQAVATPLPFVERILEYVPGVSITVERTLTLDEDLHLADHAFVHAPGVKPLSACLPVVPLTLSLEIMAEAAACLTQGLGVIGLEDVKASRWIELADTDQLVLRIVAQLSECDAERGIQRVATAIYIGGQAAPAIQSSVLFAPHYYVDLAPQFSELANPRLHQRTGEEIYHHRYMFHGPIYQCITGNIVVGTQGAQAEFLVKTPTDMFYSTREPQFLLAPALLDAVGQLAGIWATEERDRYAFPIGFKKLELYRPTPEPGSRVPVHLEVISDETKTFYADVEVQDGAGGVWMRIKEWGEWKFRWRKRLMDFRRLPTRYLFSEATALPGLDASAVCCVALSEDLSGFDVGLMARFYLHTSESSAFTDKAGVARRQQHWLLGRIAAKDAVRAWLAQPVNTSGEMLHPAAVCIENNDNGQPKVVDDQTGKVLPQISIAHCDKAAIAIAFHDPIGVDIEPVAATSDPSFLETFASSAEQTLLSELTSRSQDPSGEWLTRLWCAKEATGKLLGIGLRPSPRVFEATAVDADGTVQMIYRGSGQIFSVHTARKDNFIIAYATFPAAQVT